MKNWSTVPVSLMAPESDDFHGRNVGKAAAKAQNAATKPPLMTSTGPPSAASAEDIICAGMAKVGIWDDDDGGGDAKQNGTTNWRRTARKATTTVVVHGDDDGATTSDVSVHKTRGEMWALLCVQIGGRVAEELAFNGQNMGHGNDEAGDQYNWSRTARTLARAGHAWRELPRQIRQKGNSRSQQLQ
ncbi:hypothetical protein GPALN_005762 [Globodera pallida]|nr:hypothetical protein GPALN_005762 [Globodera pallida]